MSPCTAYSAVRAVTEDPCSMQRDWRSMLFVLCMEIPRALSWNLHDLCLASRCQELRTWKTICFVLHAMWKRCAGRIVASVAVPCSVWNRPCFPCPSSETLRKQIRINRSRSELVAIPPMFESAMSIEQSLPCPVYFRTPYIAGVKARTCFLSIGLVMASAMFWVVLT